jgi:hypothetical protein
VAAQQENIAKPPLKAQTGWSFKTDHLTYGSIPLHSHLRRPPRQHAAYSLLYPCVRIEAVMAYENIPVLTFLAILLLAGLALIADAVRRGISELREKNHDLHV